MKTIFSLIVFSGLLVGCGQNSSDTATYEFHTGRNGNLLWRCNRFTGDVEWCEYDKPVWRRVEKARSTKPLTDADVFGGNAQQPKGFVPDTK